MKLSQITPVFVAEIPRELDPGKLYVCCRYRAVMHLCACGCAASISTPLHPTAWTLICDGVSVSLWPSIGNWSEECQSHYWIHNNKIHWARKWSRHKILKSRKARDLELEWYYNTSINTRTGCFVSKTLSILKFMRSWLARLFTRTLRR